MWSVTDTWSWMRTSISQSSACLTEAKGSGKAFSLTVTLYWSARSPHLFKQTMEAGRSLALSNPLFGLGHDGRTVFALFSHTAGTRRGRLFFFLSFMISLLFRFLLESTWGSRETERSPIECFILYVANLLSSLVRELEYKRSAYLFDVKFCRTRVSCGNRHSRFSAGSSPLERMRLNVTYLSEKFCSLFFHFSLSKVWKLMLIAAPSCNKSAFVVYRTIRSSMRDSVTVITWFLLTLPGFCFLLSACPGPSL